MFNLGVCLEPIAKLVQQIRVISYGWGGLFLASQHRCA
ncbi:hypothetical protein VC87395_000071 [Vibrio paracholerae 87395]|nr:hypothetical protein VCHE09_0074 [Vibrio paracholerae HE-09]EMP96032.1 hypothetical protein VC87395_000071 [Vibrio paracholerae 87395]